MPGAEEQVLNVVVASLGYRSFCRSYLGVFIVMSGILLFGRYCLACPLSIIRFILWLRQTSCPSSGDKISSISGSFREIP